MTYKLQMTSLVGQSGMFYIDQDNQKTLTYQGSISHPEEKTEGTNPTKQTITESCRRILEKHHKRRVYQLVNGLMNLLQVRYM